MNIDFTAIGDWISEHQTLLAWLSGGSIVILIASFFLVPFLVSRLQPDYFAHDIRPQRRSMKLHPTIRLLTYVCLNVIGLVLLVAGLAMLLLPGPGAVTAMVGFFLLDFPGKYRLERWLVARPMIHRPLNWLRRRAGRQPLIIWSPS